MVSCLMTLKVQKILQSLEAQGLIRLLYEADCYLESRTRLKWLLLSKG